MAALYFIREHVATEAMRPAVSAYARQLYAPLKKRLGLKPKPGEDGETGMLRASVLGFLADTGADGAVRKDLAKLGRAYLGTAQGLNPKAVSKDLAMVAVRVALEEGDGALFDLAYQHLINAQDPATRGLLLTALSSVRDERSARALALALDPKLRVNEVTRPLGRQMSDHRTREAAWQYFTNHFDAIAERLSSRSMGYTVHLARAFCGTDKAAAVKALFEQRIDQMDGGPRQLAQAVEDLTLCGARVAQMKASAEAFFGAR